MINNRIRELEKQCWDHQSNCVDTKKFAELIVQACVTMLDHNGNYLIDDAVTKQIKQHFGVEE